MQAKHIIIEGKVQGVFFRATAKAKAEELRINGWICNTPGGQVEIMASAASAPLMEFVKWCHRGPLRARVERVEVETVDTLVEPGFKILRDKPHANTDK